MTRFIHLQDAEALSAIRVGARQAVRDALHAELGALEEAKAMLGQLYLTKLWLTVDEVAAYVGCDAESVEGRAKAVRKLHEAGLPYVVVGRQRLTLRAELDAWLLRQSRRGQEAAASCTARSARPAKRHASGSYVCVDPRRQTASAPQDPQGWKCSAEVMRTFGVAGLIVDGGLPGA